MKLNHLATATMRRRAWRAKSMALALCAALLALNGALLASCSEENEEDEFDNWQARNDAALENWAANSSYQKILTYTKDQSTGTKSTDYIYVEVLEKGSGTTSPIGADTCRVAYRGRLLPTKTYAEGYVFDQNYLGDFSWTRCGATDFVVSSSLVDGFATALMNMHVGDRWRIHFSYKLGYGTTSTTSIPAYSNLTFDIALIDFWQPNVQNGRFKSR